MDTDHILVSLELLLSTANITLIGNDECWSCHTIRKIFRVYILRSICSFEYLGDIDSDYFIRIINSIYQVHNCARASASNSQVTAHNSRSATAGSPIIRF